jgi:ribosome-associated translation inhibitor RaiA
MQIQVNGDNNIAVDAERMRKVEAEVNHVLGRFASQITRVEVHLSDANGEKSGARDKHCTIEARPAGHDPVVATDDAATVDEALRGAAQKLQRHLDHLFGRLGR